MNTYEQCKLIQRIILGRAAEVMNYTEWTSDYAAHKLRSIRADIKGIDTINISELTKAEALSLGFVQLNEHSQICLIPLWLYQFLPDGLDYESINGDKVTKVSNIDNDNRGGVLAYGIKLV